MRRFLNLSNTLLASLMLVMSLSVNTAFTFKPESLQLVKAKKNTQVITIKNTTGFRVDRIFLSPVESDDWGDDILDEDEVLEPGESVKVEITCGKWDVKLVAVDESTCEISAVNICAASVWMIQADC
jgi:hypothetical protein